MKMEILINKEKIRDISLIEVYPKPINEDLPFVIFLHEFGGRKENHIENAKTITEKGYRVLLLDAFLHGENVNAEYEDISPLKKLEQIEKIYCKTSDYIGQIVNELKRDKNRNCNVGLLGISLGGCSVLHHIIRKMHPAIKAAAVMIASPYWANHLRRTVEEYPKLQEYLTKQVINRISEIEPSNFMEEFTDLPLLFQNGSSDKLVPIDDVRKCVHKIKRNYRDEKRIRSIEYENIGHECTSEMLNVAINWFDLYLT